jgi:hypothetical protein
MKQRDFDVLDTLVHQYGIAHVLLAVAASVQHEAEHIANDLSDRKSAKHWTAASKHLEQIARLEWPDEGGA